MRKRGQKLFYYLSRFTEKELDDFHHYLVSPVLGNSLQFARILEILREKWLPDPDAQIDAEELHGILFPDKPFTEKAARYIWVRLTYFHDQLLEYLAFLEFREDKDARNRSALKAITRRGWDQYLPPLFQKSLKELPPKQGADQFKARLGLETRINDFLSTNATQGQDIHLREVMDALDHFFLLEKLKYATGARNLEIVWGEKMDVHFLDPILLSLNAEAKPELPQVIWGYYYAYQMIAHQSSSPESSLPFYQALKGILAQPEPLSPTEGLDLFTYALNFAAWQIYQGQEEFIGETKWLYDHLLESGFLTENGVLSPKYYKNIVGIMCRFGKLEWAENFLESYRARLPSDSAKLAYVYNRAVIEFHKGQHAESVKLLYNNINEFEDIFYGIGARIYLCRSLWEQKEYDWLEQSLQAFRIYLVRNRDIPPSDEKVYQSYVKFFIRIANAVQSREDKIRPKLLKVKSALEEYGEWNLFQSLRQIVEKYLSNQKKA